MKKAFLAAALVVIAAPVQAADMPVKAPAPAPAVVAPVYDWTGFYIGVHGGGAWNRGDGTVDPLPSPAAFNRSADVFDLNASSALVGVHAGYNLPLYSNFLIGVEGDWSWTHASASATAPIRNPAGVPFGTGTTSMGRDLNWLASARLRVGVPFNNLLLYATGGFAAGGAHYTGTTTAVPVTAFAWAADQRQTEIGFVVGGGGEWGLTPNLILRAEYLFYRLNGQSTTAAALRPLRASIFATAGKTTIRMSPGRRSVTNSAPTRQRFAIFVFAEAPDASPGLLVLGSL
ncbi:MAG TPA: outer membrane beta-barrel protein [Pseudolabrys sp.]